ncbi:hypothetical protein WA158_005033 [Blastocystis sp. Blastoise]
MEDSETAVFMNSFAEFCGDEEISIESNVWNDILSKCASSSIHSNDFYTMIQPMLANLCQNASSTHNLEMFMNYIFMFASTIDFQADNSADDTKKISITKLSNGIYILRIIFKYLFTFCADDELPLLFGIPHLSPKDYKEIYSYLYISDMYGYSIMKLSLLIINILILYKPKDSTDGLYLEILSLFIELFYKKSKGTTWCSSTVSPYYSENFFIDLFMITGETFLYNHENPWTSFEEGAHSQGNLSDSKQMKSSETHEEKASSEISSNNHENKDDLEGEEEEEEIHYASTWASELMYTLLLNIASNPNTSCRIPEIPSADSSYLFQIFTGISRLIPAGAGSVSRQDYICIYSEILICLLTCTDVYRINPYQNIMKIYKNNHHSDNSSSQLNNSTNSISRQIQFSPIYNKLIKNIIYEPNLVLFYCLLVYIPSFKDYVISKNDYEEYLLDLLYAIYTYSSSNPEINDTLSVILSILLLLSESPSFVSALFNNYIEKPLWFVERNIQDTINIGSFLICIIIRLIIQCCNDNDYAFLLTTGFSLLLNLLQFPTDIHIYSSIRIFDLFFFIKNKYIYTKNANEIIDCDNINHYIQKIDQSNELLYEQYTQYLLQYMYIIMVSANKEKNISLIYESLHRYMQLRPLCQIPELRDYIVPILDLLDILYEGIHMTPTPDSPLTEANTNSDSVSYDELLRQLRKQLRLLLPTTTPLPQSSCFIYSTTNHSYGFFNMYIRHVITKYCSLIRINN